MIRYAIIFSVVVSLFFIFSSSTVEKKSESVVYVTIKNDENEDESFYNDPELFISTEPNGTRVASCRGCHFECKHCEE